MIYWLKSETLFELELPDLKEEIPFLLLDLFTCLKFSSLDRNSDISSIADGVQDFIAHESIFIL